MDDDPLQVCDNDLEAHSEDSQEVYLTPPPEDEGSMLTESSSFNGPSNQDTVNVSRSHNSPIARYKRSSTARRNLEKTDDCKFCHLNVDGPGLEHHFEISKKCALLYMRFLKVPTLDLVNIRLFSCLCCKEKRRLFLKKHLLRNQECLQYYRIKYGVNDIDEIIAAVEKVKRKTHPCRSASARARSYKNRKEEEFRTKTSVSSVNEYRDKVAFGNYRICVVCSSNFREHEARAVQEDEDIFETLKLSSCDAKAFRRFGTFFICNGCSEETEGEQGANSEVRIRLGECVINDTVSFFPVKEIIQEEMDEEVNMNKIKVLFPRCLESVRENTVKISKSNHAEIRKLYQTSKVERTTISNIYYNELHKYKQAEEAGSLFTATIQNRETKSLINVEKMVNCSRITGSDEWFEMHAKRMKDRQDQSGLIHVTVEIKLPPTSSDVIATCLIQNGIPVTLKKTSLCNGELINEYMVHTSHNNQEDCPDNCVQKNLDEYMVNYQFDHDIGNKYVGTYVSSCHQKLKSFCKSILEAPDSGFYTENYKLFLVFDINGIGSIVGSFWPEKFNAINAEVALNYGEVQNKEELIKIVNKNVCCTGNPNLIQSNLGMSEEEAKVLSGIIIEHQLQFREDDNNFSVIGMPSLETIFIETCSKFNLESSKHFVQIMKVKLNRLDLLEKKRKKTTSFLNDVWEKCTGNISNDFKTIEIEVEDDKLVKFEIDERLTNFIDKYTDSPFTATYHYALSCCGNQDQSTMVLERLWIIDCFIVPFNPMFLKVAPPIQVQVVNSTDMFQSLFLRDRSFVISDEKFESRALLSHRFVSLQEAVSLSDSSIKRVGASCKEEFIDAKAKRKVFFKKIRNVVNENENFKILGSNDQFKLLESNISRHFNRSNIDDRILLAETAVWFDFLGEERSREVSETYKTLEIPLSEVESVYGSKLPQFIICKNRDVLKIRKRKKILILPKCWSNYEVMYQKCLLFLPIKTEYELHENLREMYGEMNNEGTETIVRMNERKLFEMRITKPFESQLSALEISPEALSGNANDEHEAALDALLDALDAEDNGDGNEREDIIY